MQAPKKEDLEEIFDLYDEEVDLIIELAEATDDRARLEALIEGSCPSTHAYAKSCFSDPFASGMWRVTMAMHAIDGILGTSGVECIPRPDQKEPFFEYCNAGDPYAPTLIYDRRNDRLIIGCWGDLVRPGQLKC